MNSIERLTARARALSARQNPAPSATVHYADGTSCRVAGYYEGGDAVLNGDVTSIDSGDPDFAALLWALTGTR